MESRLLHRHRAADAPRGKLDAEDQEALRIWIESGSPMPEGGHVEALAGSFDWDEAAAHWSFQPIVDPARPEVVDPVWPHADLDRYVLASLEEAGLRPAPEADRRSWLRRVSYALTGLPPSTEDLASFLTDTDPGAHERVVDRLLDSPRFGEAWGRHWLDLVRYAETKGHEFDYVIPNAWRYRDYVVRAFNADVPYDRFVTEHIAGDLLAEPRPHATEGWDESILGTGWWWLGEEMHSPVDIRGDETDRVADQVDTLSKAFLGLTVACARCHDHKFDAISQRDFTALAGFAISGQYRQVRYETRDGNEEVARSLELVRNQHEDALGSRYMEALEASAAGLPRLLHAAREVAIGRPEPWQGAIPGDLDLLVEDFEGEDWRGWVAEGDAFGVRPLRVEELGSHQGNVGARGQGLVNTHNGWREGELVHEDGLTGTLTSPPILLERNHLHFLVGGGNHAESTFVELLVDGERVGHVTGPANNSMRHAHIDVSAHRGREAVLRIVDEHTEGWGNIGIDHVVLSDRADAGALDVSARPEVLAARRAHVQRVAHSFGLGVPELEQMVALLGGAASKEAGHPLHAWALMLEAEGRGHTGAQAASLASDRAAPTGSPGTPEDGMVRLDFSSAEIPAGSGFVTRNAGDLWLDPEGERVVRGPAVLGAAMADSTWERLGNAPGTERDHGRLNWDRDERTLTTETFELASGKLHYLVRGKAKVYAAVDSHKLLHGPLHAALVRDLDGGDGFRWITHDLSRYRGHRVHLEFTPRGTPTDFAVAMVVEAEGSPGGEAVGGWAPGSPADEPARLARATATALDRAVEELRRGEGSAEGRLALQRLGRDLGIDVRSEDAKVFRTEAAEVLASRALLSHTAPAMVEGSGVDEYYLVRGNASSPTERVPRAFLTAVGGEPLADSRGSGRLALARELVDPGNPFVSRAWVNRVWHHLYGRGIVASVDDLGRMGDLPTHPELLDHLSSRFMGDLDWSTKELIREIVLSSTYRQSSSPAPRAMELDPENLLWHHVPVKRLSAEALRDGLLAVSGELATEVGGPPVPVHLTPFMEGRGRPGSSGPVDGNRRRSLYLAVRRNFLVPMLSVFDFPVPSTSIGRRTVSNVPAQALVLMNDPFVVERAAAWARRTLDETDGASDVDRVTRMFVEGLARGPRPGELEAVVSLVEEERELGADEASAWADVGHVIFNLKEFRYLR